MRGTCLFLSTSLLLLFQQSAGACGLDGDVTARIADCANAFPNTCEGTQSRDCAVVIVSAGARRFVWRLVSRDSEGRQLWRDDSSGLLWTEAFEKPLAWKAAEPVCALARNGRLKMTLGLAYPYRVPARIDFEAARAHGIAMAVPGYARLKYYWASADDALLPDHRFVRCVGTTAVESGLVEGDYKEVPTGQGEAATERKGNAAGSVR